MRKLIFFNLLLFCIHAHTQTYEIKKGISENYRIDYYDDNTIVVYNVNNPFNLSEYNSLWHEMVKIPIAKVETSDFIKRYLLPVVQNCSFNNDNNIFLMNIYISLDGIAQFIEFVYSSSLAIPIETIEEMEQAMKRECFYVLKFDPDQVSDIPYIMITRPFMLRAMLKNWTPPKQRIEREIEDLDSDLVN